MLSLQNSIPKLTLIISPLAFGIEIIEYVVKLARVFVNAPGTWRVLHGV